MDIRNGIVLVMLFASMPSDVDAQELWQYQCACRVSWETNERSRPDSVLATGDRKFIAICGNKELIDGRAVFSNVSLTQCFVGNALSGNLLFISRPKEEFTVEVSGDTLIVGQLLLWPVGPAGALEKTVVYETRYSFHENLEIGELETLIQQGTSDSLYTQLPPQADSIAKRTQALISERVDLTEEDLIRLASCATAKNAKCIELYRDLQSSDLLSDDLQVVWERYELAVRAH